MTFQKLYGKIKDEWAFRDAKKGELEEVYNLCKKESELKAEYERRRDEIHKKVTETDLYVLNGVAYCRLLEHVSGEELN